MKVSIAIATYNGERFLREQLDSLYAQTRKPDEVVVCDDASTDYTLNILEEYHQHYGLRYYKNQKSLGVNANFFQVISYCQGDYICICDQDDIWMNKKVETLLKAIEAINQNSIPIAVSSNRQDVDAQGIAITPPIYSRQSEKWEDTLLNTGNSQGCTMIINRCLADISLRYYQEREEANTVMYDVLISLIAACFGKKLNLSESLMYYRHHDSNVVDRFQKKKKTFLMKVEDAPTYYPFLLDYRIRELSVAYDLFSKDGCPDDVCEFLHKMKELHQAKSIFVGLPIILQLPQLSPIKRIKVLLYTPIVKTLKIIKRCL